MKEPVPTDKAPVSKKTPTPPADKAPVPQPRDLTYGEIIELEAARRAEEEATGEKTALTHKDGSELI